MARRRGAWGNALGGYKTQKRIKGRFASGGGGGASSAARKTKSKAKSKSRPSKVSRSKAKSRSTTKPKSTTKAKSTTKPKARTKPKSTTKSKSTTKPKSSTKSKAKSTSSSKSKSRPQNRGKSRREIRQAKRVAAVKPINPKAGYKAQRQNYKAHLKVSTRGKTAKSIQNRHRRGIIRNEAYGQVGSVVGGAIGMAYARNAGLSASGTAIVGQYGASIGSTIGRARATAVSKKKGTYFTARQLNNMSVYDRAAIVKRERNLRRAKTAVATVKMARGLNQFAKQSGVYSAAASSARSRRATRQARANHAASRGLPRQGAYTGTRVNGVRVKAAKKNRKGVYDITSMKR